MPEKIPISVCIIAYNEEYMISRCLNSIRHFDDIVVIVDSRTTDRTARIANDFKCRVFIEDWKGDGPQKQSAVDKSHYNWVLILDADERLPSDSVLMIKKALDRDAVLYSLKRKNYIGKRWIKHSGWWPDRVLRLFDKTQCWIKGITHSRIVTNGKILHLPALIEHYSFTGYTHMIEKLNRYSSLISSELYACDKQVHYLTPITHALWTFFRIFVIKKGFMDGLDGLVISLLNAGGSFFKYAKLLELKREDKD